MNDIQVVNIEVSKLIEQFKDVPMEVFYPMVSAIFVELYQERFFDEKVKEFLKEIPGDLGAFFDSVLEEVEEIEKESNQTEERLH